MNTIKLKFYNKKEIDYDMFTEIRVNLEREMDEVKKNVFVGDFVLCKSDSGFYIRKNCSYKIISFQPSPGRVRMCITLCKKDLGYMQVSYDTYKKVFQLGRHLLVERLEINP